MKRRGTELEGVQKLQKRCNVIPISWNKLSSERLLHFNDKSSRDIDITIENAPTFISLHKSMIRACMIKNRLKRWTNSSCSLRLKEGCVSWKIWWTYFALQYNIIIEDVNSDGCITVNRSCAVPFTVWRDLMYLSDYVGDETTLLILIDSLEEYVQYYLEDDKSNRYRELYDTIVTDDIDDMKSCFSILSRNVSYKIYPGVEMFIWDILKKNPHKVTKNTSYIASDVLKNGKYRPVIDAIDLCFNYEQQMHKSSSFGELDIDQEATLRNLFIEFHDIDMGDEYGECRLGRDYVCKQTDFGRGVKCFTKLEITTELIKKRLEHIWNSLFPKIEDENVAIVGSSIPLCVVDYADANFIQAVLLYFPDFTLDLCMLGKNHEQVKQNLLSKVDKYWLEEVTESHGIKISTYILPIHPIVPRRCMRLKIIQQTHGELNIYDFVLRSYLCPTRAFYLLHSNQLFMLPSAYYCWSTGIIREYRGIEPSDKINRKSVLTKYMSRGFGMETKIKTAPGYHEKICRYYATLNRSSNNEDRNVNVLETTEKCCDVAINDYKVILRQIDSHLNFLDND